MNGLIGGSGKGDAIARCSNLIKPLAEGFVFDDFEASVEVFDESGIGFDPIPGVEVMDISDHFIFGSMDVSTYEAATLVFFGEVFDLVFEARDIVNDFFGLCFDGLGEREIRFTAPCAIAVVSTIDAEEALVTDIAEDGDEL